MSDLVKKNDNLLPALMKEVEGKIVEVRGQKTLLDFHVAAVYGVETREVNQAVRNNPRKFPEGYVLELTKEESSVLRSKLLTLETLRSNNSTLEDSAATPAFKILQKKQTFTFCKAVLTRTVIYIKTKFLNSPILDKKKKENEKKIVLWIQD